MWSLWRFLDVSVMRALGAFIFGLLGVMAAGWVVLLPVEWLEDDLRGRRLWFCAGGSRGGVDLLRDQLRERFWSSPGVGSAGWFFWGESPFCFFGIHKRGKK